MKRPAPLFLAPQGYRRRRLHDAARLVPVFGAFLFLLPILWSPADTASRDTAPDGVYLFAVWAGLIAVAAFLSRRLSAEETAPEDDPPAAVPGDGGD